MRQRTRRFWFAGIGLALALAVEGYAAAQSMGLGMRMASMMGMMGHDGGQCHIDGAERASTTPVTK